ncbi:hypothetical protein [Mesorhizobium sangaii]|uniref:Uncharacterized protein n=1 Tax=Mesorhizobium sangaii TaxID=505389 RepID=A0A841PB38_9HYPH|nr:hypothetical protein [Mesorhizobium sangaii]MBB6412417.1 hypothetical protein [Mesorhizobium sangaii]
MNEIKLPENENLAMEMIKAQERERGLVGRLFGTREHAPTNIGATVLISLSVLLCVVLFGTLPTDVNRGGLITSLLSAITFVIGLIFGREVKM